MPGAGRSPLDRQQSSDALRGLCGFSGSLRRRSVGDVEAQLKRLSDHVLLLPVSRAHSSSPSLSKEKEDELRRLCEESIVRCRGFELGACCRTEGRKRVCCFSQAWKIAFTRLQKQGSTGMSDAWEGRMRDNVNNKDVQKHITGFSVPMQGQVQTLSNAIQIIVNGQKG